MDIDFELDKEAHSKGRCSFSTLALCSAEEHRVKMFIKEFYVPTKKVIIMLENINKKIKETFVDT